MPLEDIVQRIALLVIPPPTHPSHVVHKLVPAGLDNLATEDESKREKETAPGDRL